MTGTGPLMTFTEFEKSIERGGNKEEKVEQHLTLVHNKSRRGSFTSHAFPELHHKVSSAEIDLTSGASFVNSGLKLDLFT